jgi:hypothetical protein
VKAEVEYLAVVTVEVDLESGEVVSLGIRATRDEAASQVGVSLESERDERMRCSTLRSNARMWPLSSSSMVGGLPAEATRRQTLPPRRT